MFRRTIAALGLPLALIGVQADGAGTQQFPPSPGDDWCWNCYGTLCLYGDPDGFGGCHDGSNYCSVIPYRLCTTRSESRLVVGPSGIVVGEEVLAEASDGTQRGGCGNWIVGIQANSDPQAVSSDPPIMRI